MITEIDDYFTRGCGRCDRFDTDDCSTRRWAPGLAALRRLCREAGLQETVKWGHPCYRHADRNIVLLGAFRTDFRLSFFNAALLADPAGILEKAGPNTQTAGTIRFADTAEPEQKAALIHGYLREAMDHAERGLLPLRTAPEFVLPEELVAALDDDPDLAEAFHRLTPGRQRSYVINLAGAKAAKTRLARIARFRHRIIAGKGATER